MSPHECPSREALRRYAAGDSTEAEAQTINMHVGRCTVCLTQLDALASAPDTLLAALRQPAAMPDANPALAKAVAAVLGGHGLPTTDLLPGAIVNGYRIVEEIGRGGMGRVYRAIHPRLNQDVALKILRPGAESARFQTELRALTLMDHPHVARVLDGGVTEDGRPFLVMELVRGAPLARYADQHRLTIAQRLELFIGVCHAIQHAHQKGIIHRDLKPSNVLVAEYGGKRTPKVIDFGVAKDIDRGAGQTEVGMIIGTLEYMSPEQADAHAVDIDTRSDVYSLGVLLYELVTGSTPWSNRDHKMPILEALRVLAEVQPAAPSARARSSPTLRDIAANRCVASGALIEQLHGDLDWITLKALEKDRTRRYATASALADDVQRCLNHEPVSAGPPSRTYRLRKFVRRNRGGVVAAGLLIVTLVGGIIGTGVAFAYAHSEWGRAEKERDEKNNALSKLETQQTLTQAALTAEVSANKEADQQKRKAEKERDEKNAALSKLESQQALTQAALTAEVSANKEADQQKRKAEKERDEKNAALVAETQARRQAMAALRSLTDYAVERQFAKLTHLGKDDRRFLTEIMQQYEAFAALPGEDSEQRSIRAEGHQRVAWIRGRLGHVKEAESSYLKAIALYKALSDEAPMNFEYRRDLALSRSRLGIVYREHNRFEETEVEFRADLDLCLAMTRDFPKNPDCQRYLGAAYLNLGSLLRLVGRIKEAEEPLNSSVATFKKLVAASPKDAIYRSSLARAYFNLAVHYRVLDRLKEAEAALIDAGALHKELADELPTWTDLRQEWSATLHTHANILRLTKRHTEAEKVLTEALKLRRQLALASPGRPDLRVELAATLAHFGILYRETKRAKESEAMYLEAIGLQKKLVADFPNRPDLVNELGTSHNNLGAMYRAEGYLKAAEEHYNHALKMRRWLVAESPDAPDYNNNLAGTLVNLANMTNNRRDFADAQRYLEEGAPHHQAALKTNSKHPTYREYYHNHLVALTRCRAGLGNHSGATEVSQTILKLGWDPPKNAFEAARALVTCIPTLEKNTQLDEAERRKVVQSYADEAMSLLGTAVSLGYRNSAVLAKDVGFNPLRQRADFQKLLADLGKSR